MPTRSNLAAMFSCVQYTHACLKSSIDFQRQQHDRITHAAPTESKAAGADAAQVLPTVIVSIIAHLPVP